MKPFDEQDDDQPRCRQEGSKKRPFVLPSDEEDDDEATPPANTTSTMGTSLFDGNDDDDYELEYYPASGLAVPELDGCLTTEQPKDVPIMQAKESDRSSTRADTTVHSAPIRPPLATTEPLQTTAQVRKVPLFSIFGPGSVLQSKRLPPSTAAKAAPWGTRPATKNKSTAVKQAASRVDKTSNSTMKASSTALQSPITDQAGLDETRTQSTNEAEIAAHRYKQQQFDGPGFMLVSPSSLRTRDSMIHFVPESQLTALPDDFQESDYVAKGLMNHDKERVAAVDARADGEEIIAMLQAVNDGTSKLLPSKKAEFVECAPRTTRTLLAVCAKYNFVWSSPINFALLQHICAHVCHLLGIGLWRCTSLLERLRPHHLINNDGTPSISSILTLRAYGTPSRWRDWPKSALVVNWYCEALPAVAQWLTTMPRIRQADIWETIAFVAGKRTGIAWNFSLYERIAEGLPLRKGETPKIKWDAATMQTMQSLLNYNKDGAANWPLTNLTRHQVLPEDLLPLAPANAPQHRDALLKALCKERILEAAHPTNERGWYATIKHLTREELFDVTKKLCQLYVCTNDDLPSRVLILHVKPRTTSTGRTIDGLNRTHLPLPPSLTQKLVESAMQEAVGDVPIHLQSFQCDKNVLTLTFYDEKHKASAMGVMNLWFDSLLHDSQIELQYPSHTKLPKTLLNFTPTPAESCEDESAGSLARKLQMKLGHSSAKVRDHSKLNSGKLSTIDKFAISVQDEWEALKLAQETRMTNVRFILDYGHELAICSTCKEAGHKTCNKAVVTKCPICPKLDPSLRAHSTTLDLQKTTNEPFTACAGRRVLQHYTNVLWCASARKCMTGGGIYDWKESSIQFRIHQMGANLEGQAFGVVHQE